MESWNLEQLDERRDFYDQTVLATPDIDPFCSSTDWILPATTAFAPGIRPWILRTDAGFLTFAERRQAQRIILHSLDPMWGFACPLIGPDPHAIVADLYRALQLDRRWQTVAISGVVEDSALFHALIDIFQHTHQLFRGTAISSHLTSLDGGTEAFLSRRTAKFRKNIRQSSRRADERGITFEHATVDQVAGTDSPAADELLNRALAVESRSWKAGENGGIIDPRMQEFYRLIARRLVPESRLRLIFARHEGADIGYILGGVRDGVYRGFQVSFDQEWAAMSVGNLLQWNQIQHLVDEGITGYDLGMDMGYKARWSDETFDSMTVVIRI